MIYFICTPIGNLNDISSRSIGILNTSDLIYAEDTRRAKKIFDKFKIEKKSFSFNDHNERVKTKKIIKEASEGKIISVLSDAGAPLISDPGYYLVSECIKKEIEYTVIPGPSSVINSLMLSGLRANQFIFLGFMPKKDTERKKVLTNYAETDMTLIFFESPKRLKKTLYVMKEIYPSRIRVAVCREMTKTHEEVIRGTIGEVCDKVYSKDIKGEVCLLVEGQQNMAVTKLNLDNAIKDLLLDSLSPSEAAKLLSLITKKNKRDFYNWLIQKS